MSAPSHPDPGRAPRLSTAAFTVCFAVWTLLPIIGIQVRDHPSLSETQFDLLVGVPILTGSRVRIVLGVATDRLGGGSVCTLTMLAAAATFLLSWALTYSQTLLAALRAGIVGGSLAGGVAHVSRFFDRARQGTALGIFGVGTVGAAVTKSWRPS